MKKVYIGLLAGVLMLVIVLIIGFVLQTSNPSLLSEYQNPLVYMSWTDPLNLLYFIEPFIVGIILSWIWSLTKEVNKNISILKRGLLFALIYWTISIPGLLVSYSEFPISKLMITTWSFTILAQALFSGILFSKTLK